MHLQPRRRERAPATAQRLLHLQVLGHEVVRVAPLLADADDRHAPPPGFARCWTMTRPPRFPARGSSAASTNGSGGDSSCAKPGAARASAPYVVASARASGI